jgi:hypothetical protein
MSAEVAARIFHDWAAEAGLMPDGPVVPPVSTPAELATVLPATDAGKQILRARQVESVAFNEADAEIIVFTRRIVPVNKKQRASLPSRVGNIDIIYHQGVPGIIGTAPSASFAGPVYSVRTVSATDFYTCGSSISVGNGRDAGTLGALVTDAAGVIYGLSANHVSGGCSFAGAGLPIVAPGIFDVVPNSLAPFTIGYHKSTLPFVAGQQTTLIQTPTVMRLSLELRKTPGCHLTKAVTTTLRKYQDNSWEAYK